MCKKMKIFFIFCVCVISGVLGKTTHAPKSPKTNDTEKPVCEGIHVHGKLHKKHVIMNGINRPYQLAIYNREHKIFFSYNEGKDSEDTFGIAYVKINDTMPTDIKEIKNGFAIAIDEQHKTVYFGGNEGIYTHNLAKKDHNSKHIIQDRDIWDMFFKHHLFFIEYPSQRVHRYDKENNVTLLEHIHEKIYQFAIDGEGDTFITTRDGLLEIKEGTFHRIPYKGPKIFRAIEVNHKGVAHFCAQSGIYVADKANHTLIEIASIKDIFGLTFDSDDNIIYSNPHEIVKLLPHDCK